MQVDVIRTTLNTSTGSQDITGDLGGNTPKAVIFFPCGAISDGTHANHARIGVGFSDGTNHYANAIGMQNGVSTTNTCRAQTQSDCIIGVNPLTTSTELRVEFDEFITNGVRVNITDTPGSAYFVHALLLSGADVSAKVGVASVSAEDVEIHITDVGFTSDLVFCTTIGTHQFDSTLTHAVWGLGAANGTNQANISHYTRDGDTTVRCFTRCGGTNALADTDSTLLWELEVSAIDSAGFSFYPRNGDGTVTGYLALGFDNDSTDIQVIDTPTSTGNDSQVLGISPQVVMMLMTSCDAVDTFESGADSGNFGVSLFDASTEYSVMVCDEDNVATTDTSSLSDDAAVNFDDHNADDLMDATFVSMDATGFTLNYSNADSTARKWISIAIEGTTVETVQFQTEILQIVGYAPTAFKDSQTMVITQELTITGYAVTAEAISGVDVAEPILGSDNLVITGQLVKISTGEFTAKPETGVLSIGLGVFSLALGSWVEISDKSTVWTDLTDQCRSN